MSALRESRGGTASAEAPGLQRRMVAAGPIVAVVSMVAAIIATDAAGIPIRDPDHVAGRRLRRRVLDGRPADRARHRDPRRPPGARAGPDASATSPTCGGSAGRCAAGRSVGAALLSFYATYLAYRNLKSFIPLLRPGDLFDTQLQTADRAIFAGHDPAALMHSIFGTSEITTQAFSSMYMLFFAFIPATLAFALVFSPNLQAGLFYATAQSLNWVLGAASYFLLPSLGPIYTQPGRCDAIRAPARRACRRS